MHNSPFLTPGANTEANSLAILHLRRDHLIPAVLRTTDTENQGYEEGQVVTTRYGSFPHTTMIGKPWGSQIVASNVDTGSRGRRMQGKGKGKGKDSSLLKRKASDIADEGEGHDSANASTDPAAPTTPSAPLKAPTVAASGFLHITAPTPEYWTASLPHRTQVVYTPDYSYILHRLRVRPGSSIIEAGAGSGSFTHAAVRAVFSGYPSDMDPSSSSASTASQRPKRRRQHRYGKVCSFEFNEDRANKIHEEVHAHGLADLVEVNHRDAYNEGFLLDKPFTGRSPRANAVFLDLPAPWQALKHLVRQPIDGTESPLDPSTAVHLCAFLPCMEQVQQVVSELRQHGWISISMVEIEHRGIEVRRERFSVEGEGGRGTIGGSRNFEEAIDRLLVHEQKNRSYKELTSDLSRQSTDKGSKEENPPSSSTSEAQADTKEVPDRSTKENTDPVPVPIFNQGRITTRWENEIRTHTSYLVFAILPMSWSEEDEKKAQEQWPSSSVSGAEAETKKSKKQMQREAKAAERAERAAANPEHNRPEDAE